MIHIPAHYTTHLPVKNVVRRGKSVANKKIQTIIPFSESESALLSFNQPRN
jgi:hypothetical protein